MKNLLSVDDFSKQDLLKIFSIADEIEKYKGVCKDKTFVLFFPDSSIRTRVTFEKAVYFLGGQSVLFPSTALDKDEKTEDVIGYLNNWADCIIVRHKNDCMLEEIAEYSHSPVINAMSANSHPCEIISDLYSFKKLGRDIENEKFLFVGPKGNIGNSYKQASEIFGYEFVQCCPKGYEIDGVQAVYDLKTASDGADIILTDSLNNSLKEDFKDYTITKEILEISNERVLVNPCPPFCRNVEVSEDVILSKNFVGYSFKKSLLEIQAAIMIFLAENNC